MAAPPFELLITSGPHLRATRGGDVRLELRCAGGAPGCHGTVSIRSARRVPSRWLTRGRPRLVTLAKVSFALPTDGAATVTLRLSDENLALLRRMQTIRVVARATAADRAGNAVSAARALRLHAPSRLSSVAMPQ